MAAAKPAPYDFQIEPSADAQFPAEKGRYHLYVTYSCPFACRALAARNLLGLEDVIGLSVAHPIFQKTKPDDAADEHKGWTFVDPETSPTFTGANGKTYPTTDCIPDTVNGVKFVRDLYEKVDPAPRTFSVPVLWDKKTQTIVSEESAGILRTLDSGFRELVPSNVHLYPEELRAEIDAANDGIVTEVTMGFFKKLFAPSPEDAALAEAKTYEALAKLDAILAKQRYLVGEGVTEADVRLFHTLIRLDVYQLKSDKHLTEYPNIVGYLRELYQIPGLKSTVNWDHLKIGMVNKAPHAAAEGPFVDYDAAHELKRTIVSDDSAGILRTLDSGFRDLVPSDVHLYPEVLQEKIDAANDGIVAEVSMALIKKLVSKSADDVASATAQAFAAVAKLDDILAQQRYLVGDSVTEADVRMFHSLIRLDYLRDLYQIPGLKSTVTWDHLKIGVESKKPGAVAEGPFVDYAAAHERNLLA
ncbi:Glutathione S-transferase [Phytophthora cinnamomi]|uniref:Glutathione S-transferase n=1 Tax=Phytophthora cinnamomi TaxID=4785 RepID=UPI0035597F25|nr:Glutathione S-transferase [Phytophthora cinnamomi]